MATAPMFRELLDTLTLDVKKEFKEKNYILSFDEYLEILFQQPRRLTRNAAEYMKDMIDFFGVTEEISNYGEKKRHFRVFERRRSKSKPPIIGQQAAHESIYRVLEQFVRQGRVDKLILLHGPNGSSKSSTAESLAQALEEYSRTQEGAVYRFNWIFPTDKVGYEGLGTTEAAKRIGFGDSQPSRNGKASFAHLPDEEVLCKIVSELKENPIFVLPKTERMQFFQKSLEHNLGRKMTQDDMPIHLEDGAMSAKNKRIFDALLVAYQGDLDKVLRHVQVERFFFSSRYRIGIATVEPQMNIDAQDKQLTMDRHIQNIPPVLQNIRMFEPQGELVDANRGFIEFSDLLKRPLEAFKYLLTTVEKMNVNLASGIADLDQIMMASTNEKHLDAFKASPDWPSFKGRFELVRVPYLLSSKMEELIYEEDVRVIGRTKHIGPHSIELIAKWAVLTRLRQPDPEFYDFAARGLIARLDPFEKLALYDGGELSSSYSDSEKNTLKKLAVEVKRESQISVAYEGRFGASPREMKMLLYFAAQNLERDSLSALAVFEEIEKLTRDRTIYDYLQFEARGGFHDYKDFLRYIKALYAKDFQREFLAALDLFDERQYKIALQRYLRNVVAYIKKERVENDITGKMEEPNETIMEELEALMGATGSKRDVREHIVAKTASWRVDNPGTELEITKVFETELQSIAKRIYESKEDFIQKARDGMMMFGSPDYEKLPRDIHAVCEETFGNLQNRFHYTKHSAWEGLIFVRPPAS